MNPYNNYQENQVLTASPERILLMLYDGAIRFTRQAISGIENKNLTQQHRGIKNVMAIITEFANSLDHKVGGKIAEDLAALYGFMNRELLAANLNKDVEKLRGVERLLMNLRETWGEAVETNRQEKLIANRVVAVASAANSAMNKSYAPFSVSG